MIGFMATCWYCGVKLHDGVNTSEEHIIPDALGGRITSLELLCSIHNSSLGDTLDADLYKQLAPFVKLVNPVRDRPDDSFIDLIKEDGERTKRRSGFKSFYPIEIVIPDKKTVTIYKRNREEAESFIKEKISEFERKGISCTVSHINNESSINQLIVANQVGTNRNIFGEKLILRAVSKIVIIITYFVAVNKNSSNHLLIQLKMMTLMR